MSLNNRSAFVSVPGKDALVEYEAKSYPVKAYVERNGLIFKSVSATSETFILSQWELVGDLREVRVPTIAARNTLTGTTGTSYGVHIPILDNTNVLVLDASGDPEVGTAQFARYNYNQGDASWLLLQVGTGATSASTSIEYANVLNRPFVVSGVTVNAGSGLSGGGAVFGSIPAAGGVISIAHADTSTQANLVPTGRTYVQQLKFDTFGHVTGATQSTWTHPDTSSQANVLNTGRTYVQSISVDGDGHITNIASSPWTHPDTSSQADSVNGGSTFIQTLYLDGDGHVIGIGTGVASGGGGGGSSFKYNGDSGGVLTANSGATVTFSGGTNIQTVRTGNAANPGLRINFNAAGLVNQLQFNNGSGGLSASSNLVFSAVSSTLRTGNLVIGSLPVSGTSGDQFLSRNVTTGAIQRVTINTIANGVSPFFSANNGINKIGNNFRLGGVLTGDTFFTGSGIDLYFQNRSISLGNRQAGTIGNSSFSVGSNNLASGQYSVAVGFQAKAIADYAFAHGVAANANGISSYAAGNTVGSRPITASGLGAFNYSTNTSFGPIGYGAHGAASAILGGQNHNIASGNTRAAIIGGIDINLTGTSYINTTAVHKLAIIGSIGGGLGTDEVLVKRSGTGIIYSVPQSSLLTPPAGANSQVQINIGGAFGVASGLTYGSNTLFVANAIVYGNLEIQGQAFVQQGSLIDGASIAWNLNVDGTATVTLAGARTLANPSNMKAGGTYYLIVRQDASGGRTLAYGSAYKWSGGIPPTLTLSANSVDILTFICDGSFMYGVVTPNLL